jgi:hypothetical protein
MAMTYTALRLIMRKKALIAFAKFKTDRLGAKTGFNYF